MRKKSVLEDQGGFTLLEAMIAFVVLAVGLLGLAGMQGIALSRNVDAKELSQAVNLAAEMIERIQFNKQNVAAYQGIDTTIPLPNPCPNATLGSPEITARGDCLQWKNSVDATALDNVRGQVTVSATGPALLNQSQVQVTLSWTTKRGEKKVALPATVSLMTVVTPI